MHTIPLFPPAVCMHKMLRGLHSYHTHILTSLPQI